jgi:hypothetical protein
VALTDGGRGERGSRRLERGRLGGPPVPPERGDAGAERERSRPALF